jgi:3-phenylpropionate/cinnamic acid dioxygenase small subunit
MGSELHYEISKLLTYEAYLLDNRRFEEWLDLLTDDIVYRMPLRVTREKRDGSDIIDDMAYFEESKRSLTLRVKRLGTTSAWAEDPPPRTRHLITNIMIEEESENSLKVRSNFLLLRTRAKDLETEQVFGERIDTLRKEDGQWKIAERRIIPDQTVMTAKNLSMFF